MVQHRSRPDPDGDVGRRQAFRPPLVLEEGDLLWKCWITNVHKGVHVQVLSARRAGGTFSAAIVFIREDKAGKPTARFWVKHDVNQEQVIELANDLMKAVADDRLHFRIIDLSALKDIDAQMAALHDEGFEILSITRGGHEPRKN